MNAITSIVSLKTVKYKAQGCQIAEEGDLSPSDRQERLSGFDQGKLHASSVGLIGAGGIGGMIGLGLVRKGLGNMSIYDGDDVEVTNLGRQLFYPGDLGGNKAVGLGKNLLPHAIYPTAITAYPLMYQDVIASGKHTPMHHAVVCGPDNDIIRVYAAKQFLRTTPIMFIGIGGEAEHGYVFLQKPGEACFGCCFPKAVSNDRYPCPGTPAIIDILMITAGLALTALDSVLMPKRGVGWNFWDIYSGGVVPTQPRIVERRKDCPICGGGGS